MLAAVSLMNNNQVRLSGVVQSEFKYSHEVFGEHYYIVFVGVFRNSNTMDLLPVMVSDRMISVRRSLVGEIVRINGQFRSYNVENRRLMLVVFARSIRLERGASTDITSNTIYLNGYLCKPPVYRRTPLGREITDLLIAVNRSYEKTDYIPCICWGRNARYSSHFEVGTHIQLAGRVQSRIYRKKMDNSEIEFHTAYEISVSRLQNISN